MSVRAGRARYCGIVILLFNSAFNANGDDRKIVDAARRGDMEAVRSLLKQHVNVNTPEADGSTALAWAAHRNDLAIADLLIRAGANVNAANAYGVTPLSLACDSGNAAVVDRLLMAGADPNAARSTGETALMTAARTGNLDAVRSLLAHAASVNARESSRDQTALMWAVAENHTEIAHVLIDHGAEVHARSKHGFTPLLFAAQQGNLDSARMLLAAGANVNDATPEYGNALVVASASGHEALSIFLLEKGADANSADNCGVTALHYAVLKGLARVGGVRFEPIVSYWIRPNMPNLVKALLSHGAKPNVRILKMPPLPDTRKFIAVTPVGATPFLLAAATYDAGIMRMLAANGADPLLATNEHTTPLMVAAGLAVLGYAEDPLVEDEDNKRLEAVKLAVELGADVNAANDTGQTALHGAAYVGSDAAIQFLASKGAKVDARDKYGQTPLSIAAQITPPKLADNYLKPRSVHKSAADLLRRLGASRSNVAEPQN